MPASTKRRKILDLNFFLSFKCVYKVGGAGERPSISWWKTARNLQNKLWCILGQVQLHRWETRSRHGKEVFINNKFSSSLWRHMAVYHLRRGYQTNMGLEVCFISSTRTYTRKKTWALSSSAILSWRSSIPRRQVIFRPAQKGGAYNATISAVGKKVVSPQTASKGLVTRSTSTRLYDITHYVTFNHSKCLVEQPLSTFLTNSAMSNLQALTSSSIPLSIYKLL